MNWMVLRGLSTFWGNVRLVPARKGKFVLSQAFQSRGTLDAGGVACRGA